MLPLSYPRSAGHEIISVEAGAAKVVSREDGYVVVDMIRVAGAIAEEDANNSY